MPDRERFLVCTMPFGVEPDPFAASDLSEVMGVSGGAERAEAAITAFAFCFLSCIGSGDWVPCATPLGSKPLRISSLVALLTPLSGAGLVDLSLGEGVVVGEIWVLGDGMLDERREIGERGGGRLNHRY